MVQAAGLADARPAVMPHSPCSARLWKQSNQSQTANNGRFASLAHGFGEIVQIFGGCPSLRGCTAPIGTDQSHRHLQTLAQKMAEPIGRGRKIGGRGQRGSLADMESAETGTAADTKTERPTGSCPAAADADSGLDGVGRKTVVGICARPDSDWPGGTDA